MQEYKREYERAAKFIETLERTEQDCEAELSAVNIYWEQVNNLLLLRRLCSFAYRKIMLTFNCKKILLRFIAT